MKTDAALDCIEREIKRDIDYFNCKTKLQLEMRKDGVWAASMRYRGNGGPHILRATGVTPRAALSNLANAL